MVSISLSDIDKTFENGFRALTKVNLYVEAGELFFLLGSSGCGKTTLLRIIAGFTQPDSGSLQFGQKNITDLPPHKRDTAMMFQSYALWPHMNVFGNVAFGLEQRKVAKIDIDQRVRNALRAVRMLDFADRKIAQLSGGQQQRVALARALVVRPKCLLLDEPLSNLDANLRVEMRSEIRRVCKENQLTAVYVTHDRDEALSIADRIAIMKNGKIAQVDTPRNIYTSPSSQYVANFIGSTNILEGTIIGIAGANRDLYNVSTEEGTFTGRNTNPNWRVSAGDAVAVCVRPESFRLNKLPSDYNTIVGRLGRADYRGEVAHYQLLSVNDSSFKVSELNPSHLDDPADELIYAHVKPEDVIILPQ